MFRSGGDTSAQLTVTIVDDNVVEMDEEFSVQLSSTTPQVTVQEGVADVTITDDDGKGRVEANNIIIIACYADVITFSQLWNLALRQLLTVLLNRLVWLRWVWSSTVAPPALFP